jgi:urease beta subunit
VRFEPGESKTVRLADIGGRRYISGGSNLFPGLVPTPGINPVYAGQAGV